MKVGDQVAQQIEIQARISGKFRSAPAATGRERRVLPMPPMPVSVVSRALLNRAATAEREPRDSIIPSAMQAGCRPTRCVSRRVPSARP